MSKSILPSRVKVFRSYVFGILSGLFNWLFFSRADAAIRQNTSPPTIVISAPLSTTPLTGTPSTWTAACCCRLPWSLILTWHIPSLPSSESDENKQDIRPGAADDDCRCLEDASSPAVRTCLASPCLGLCHDYYSQFSGISTPGQNLQVYCS